MSTVDTGLALANAAESPHSFTAAPVARFACARSTVKTDRNANVDHRMSLSRDAEFMKNFVRLSQAGGLGASIRSIVCMEQQRLLDRLKRKKKRRGIVHPVGSRPLTRWYERVSWPPAKSHRKGAPWRDATWRLRAEFAHYALSQGREFYSFNLHLGDDVEKAARKRGEGAKRYLVDRLSHWLDRALGRGSQFWFVLEESDSHNRHLHLHGAIACDKREAPKVRKALRAAGGNWDRSAIRFQATTEPDPDNGSISYASKDYRLQAAGLFKRTGDMAWLNDPFMITRGLNMDARALYESVRGSVILSAPGLKKLIRDGAL
jgi:hypothetical protein